MRALLAAATVIAAACRRDVPVQPPLVAQVTGTVTVDGLQAPVRVVRDRWGIPHIYAASQNDLFVAQGFVQAQDRLFQMDLWRRAAQGRLSEVLGPNFIERDAMTRRIQYAGDAAADWMSYGADARVIAFAFVRGVNAYVTLARQHPPEAFTLAGWRPEPWSAEDLLNRTDAVVERAGLLAEIARAGFGDVVADAVRRAGAPPFFTGLAGPVRSPAPGRVDRELSSAAGTVPVSTGFVRAVGPVLEFAEVSNRFMHPSARYLVHLAGAGWNVIGITSPWRPGVAAGHNDHVAWGFAPSGATTQMVRAIPDALPVTATVTRTIGVKGRDEPFSFETQSTEEGIVIATDRDAHRRFVFSWTGFEPGTAPEMMSLVLDRTTSRRQFEEVVRGWRLPARRFVAQDSAEPPAPLRRESRGDDTGAPDEGRPRRALFAHALGVTEQARRRFNIGPVMRAVDDQPVRLSIDVRSWNDSRAMNAPGQSEDPDSAHFSDLVRLWSTGSLIPLAYTDAAVEANADATLMLMPAASKASP